MPSLDSFKTRTSLSVGTDSVSYYSLPALAQRFPSVTTLPYSLKILLENLLRREDEGFVKQADIEALASWSPETIGEKEISFMPARVLLQDFTGVPCVVDLAAMRDGIVALGGDPQKVNPLQPVELVIDHSVQVDHFGTAERAGAQRRSRVLPQSRTLRVPALGADRLPQLPRRAARDRASCTRSTSSTWRASCAASSPIRGRSPIRTRCSAPTRTPPWSTGWAWSAGAWAASRPRPRCSVSQAPC